MTLGLCVRFFYFTPRHTLPRQVAFAASRSHDQAVAHARAGSPQERIFHWVVSLVGLS